jgi:hypothetical protein
LRRADEEREDIVFETCVFNQKDGGGMSGIATFKRALIGIGDIAPIRDR